MDAAIVEAYALAFGLRLQRFLADKGTYAPVVIDRPAALANIMAEIEGRGPRALGEYGTVLRAILQECSGVAIRRGHTVCQWIRKKPQEFPHAWAPQQRLNEARRHDRYTGPNLRRPAFHAHRNIPRCRVVKVGWHAKCRVKRLCFMSGQLRVGVEELRWYGRGTCVRSARATAEAKVKAWLARQAHSGIMAEAEHADDVDSGEFPGEVVGLVLEFSPHNEEQAWG